MGLLKAKRDGKMVAYRLDKAAVIVGSGESCNIRVPDAGLVSRHCQILKMENGYVLRDMSGDVGTFVNGKKVKEHLLSDRDLIQVGKERFTFSVSAGENTSRVAVSVAPPAAAPAHGNTSRRVAAVPPAVAPAVSAAKGNTGRIAAAPPKTDRVERGTGRIAAPAPAKTTGRTQKVTGGTKKITARTAAAMGYQTSRSTFAMPSTRKGKMIAIGAVLAVIAIGGIFYAINASQIKPEEIKAEMAKEIKDMEKLKDKPVELDAEVERFLSKYEPVKKHVMSIYAKIEKDHGPVHSAADKLREANKAVQPFFNKFAAAKAGKPEEFKGQAQVLYDECRSLAESHGMTVHGDKLREMQAELMAILANQGPGWETSIIPLQGEVKAHAKKGEFAQAAAKIKEFGEKFNEKDNAQLFAKLKGEREYLDRESPRFVDREFSKGQKEVQDGALKKDDFKKKLEGFRAGLEGYKAALDKLENHILTVK